MSINVFNTENKVNSQRSFRRFIFTLIFNGQNFTACAVCAQQDENESFLPEYESMISLYLSFSLITLNLVHTQHAVIISGQAVNFVQYEPKFTSQTTEPTFQLRQKSTEPFSLF